MEINRFPTGGLNVDDSIEILDPSDWSYAANIVAGKSYNGKSGEKENIMGTTLLDSSTYTDANSKLIGVIKSAEADVNYLFFYNTVASKHCILKLQESTISLVLQWSGLNFQNDKDHRINGGGIAGSLLYFTDDYNEPRCVHLTRYSDGSTPDNEEEILHIKRGPQFAPEVREDLLFTNGGKAIDDAQFAYQYEYEDGQLSVISPWTRLVRGYGEDGVIPVEGGLDHVYIQIGSAEIIPALVKKIKLVARRGNDGTPFYWDEDSTGPFLSSDTFLYTEQNLGTVPSDYLKDSDLIPQKVKASCITKSRAWFANYLEGYDTPPASDIALTFSLVDTSSIFDVGPTFAPNSRYRLGVVFHDEQGRSCGVVDGGWELSIDPAVEQDVVRKNLKYRITGTPPSWAYSYSLVMTKDLVKTFFINGYATASNVTNPPYVTVDSGGVESYSTSYSSSTRYIRLNMAGINAEGIFYSFNEGDLAIVTNFETGVTYGPLKVRKISGEFIYVDAVDMVNDSNFRILFQIYTPNESSEGLFYEVARRQVVAGSMDVTDYFIYGDSINRPADSFQVQMRYYVKDGGWEFDIGKPFIKTAIGQVQKKAFVKFSSPFIQGTSVNGLSEFNVGDEGSVPEEAVSVQKLTPTIREASDGDLLLAICNSNTYSIYMGETRMSTNDGSFLVASPNIIGDVRKQRSGLGTLHPESVYEESGYVYFYDHLSRSFCRYATNGIFPISEYKVVDYFEDQAVLNSSADEVVVGYDPFYKLIFVTFKEGETTTKKTIAWSTKKERWISFFDFAPDGYIVGSKNLYSVVAGSIYVHSDDASDGFNKFYGTTFSSLIDLSFNDNPDVPKNWEVIQLNLSNNFYSFSNGNQVIGADALRVDISNRHGQATSILYNEFEVDENLVYGEIRGDENSSGGLLQGDPMYSNTAQARITFAGGSYKQILMAKIGFEPSRGHSL